MACQIENDMSCRCDKNKCCFVCYENGENVCGLDYMSLCEYLDSFEYVEDCKYWTEEKTNED